MRCATAIVALSLVSATPLSPDSSGSRAWKKDDLEATRLVLALERAQGDERTAILDEIAERRLPQTVPALCLFLSEEELISLHSRFCERSHLGCGFDWAKDAVREDPFERALCLSNFYIHPTHGLKQRG